MVSGIGVAVRLLLSRVGYNFDLESWSIATRLVLGHQSVYVHTARYPYAPIGLGFLAPLQWLAQAFGANSIQDFHLLVAAFLSLVDVGLALLLRRTFGFAAACVFLLNPVSLLVTGYHSQIDNVALLVGFGSFLLLRTASATGSRAAYFVSAALIGISLGVKHVLLLFPLWVAVESGKTRWRAVERFSYVAIAYGMFAASFVLYLVFHPDSLPGIRWHVFAYRGYEYYGQALVPTWTWRLVTGSVHRGGPAWGHFLQYYWVAWLAVLAILGVWVARKMPERSFFVYLVALVLLTPTIADQYLVIPILACATRPWRLEGWLYTFAATGALLASVNYVGVSVPLQHVIWNLHGHFHLPAVSRTDAQLPLILLLFSMTLGYAGVVKFFRRKGAPTAHPGIRSLD